ncbi:MAG: vWA domain-containing protein [Solirubrobacterales bacterium]
MTADPKTPFLTGSVIGNYIGTYFGLGQGIRLGDSTVASLFAHKPMPGRFSHVKILINQDAGQHYLQCVDAGQVVHLSIFHTAGRLDPVRMAKQVFYAIQFFLTQEFPELAFEDDQLFERSAAAGRQIYLATRTGSGLVYDLMQGETRAPSEEEAALNHVRVLWKLDAAQYRLILPVAAAIEDAIMEAGLAPARVKRILHVKEKPREESLAAGLHLPWRGAARTNPTLLTASQNRLITKLAERFGTVESAADFLSSYSLGFFRRAKQVEQRKRFGDLSHYEKQLQDLGMIKNGLLGLSLTRDGKELLAYLEKHQCELEAELRRAIRHSPHRSRRSGLIKGKLKGLSLRWQTNRNKTVGINQAGTSGELAIPETVVRAKVASLIRGERGLSFRPEDFSYYQRRSLVPINICLLIDASTSMAGSKWLAAFYLAEYLLLTGRDKVSVVTFQNNQARVAVPFTRNQKTLTRSLLGIVPNGMTPLAAGIVTALDLIKKSRLSNPVLVLITDGMPTSALWSFHAGDDGLRAAAQIADKRIRFICIGVEANRSYLTDLIQIAKGHLHVVDDLNRKNLVEIVSAERKRMALSRKR